MSATSMNLGLSVMTLLAFFAWGVVRLSEEAKKRHRKK